SLEVEQAAVIIGLKAADLFEVRLRWVASSSPHPSACHRARRPDGAIPVSHTSAVASDTATSPPGRPPRNRTPPNDVGEGDDAERAEADERTRERPEEEAERDAPERDPGERREERGTRCRPVDALRDGRAGGWAHVR